MLLSLKRKLYPCDSKRNLEFTFLLPPGCQRLMISFNYTPKVLDDLQESEMLIRSALAIYAPESLCGTHEEWQKYLPVVNLITLSLDAPNGYRGCAHRHDNQQYHVFTPTEAPLGFNVGDLTVGTWHIVVNCHAVVCPCELSIDVDCDLEVIQ